MTCGPCVYGDHHKCNGLLVGSYGFCACADRDHEMPLETPSRFCPLCFDGQRAFAIEQTEKDTVWSCSQGHLTLTEPVEKKRMAKCRSTRPERI